MADYTIELRTIVENGTPIFDFPYDFYDESKRLQFEENFIRHFYFREIGCETIDRFKWYLADKMRVVFPYYNELFKSASIKYDVLDNYKLTETYTRIVESNNKGGGVSSTVGRLTDEQKTETDESRTTNTTGNIVDDKLDETTETGKSTTTSSETVDNDTTTTSTTNGTTKSTTESSGTKTTEGSGTNSNETTEKFLDTPQGAVDFSNAKYLTTLKGVDATGEQTNNTTETASNTATENGTTNQTTNGLGTSDTTTNGESETDTTRNGKNTVLTITDTTGKEKTDGKLSTVSNGEQVSSQDNNTRHYATGESSETYTLTRRGNIGVDTDSDAIEKHNRLQKTLRNIEKMFFDECEDLFMLVY